MKFYNNQTYLLYNFDSIAFLKLLFYSSINVAEKNEDNITVELLKKFKKLPRLI